MLETGDLVDAPTDTRAARCVRAATVLPLSGVILLVGFQDCLRGLPSGADSPAFPPSQAPPQNVTRTLGPTASRSKGVCSCLAGFPLQAHPAQELWGCWGEVVPHLWPSKVAFPEKMRAALGRFHLNSNLIGIYL